MFLVLRVFTCGKGGQMLHWPFSKTAFLIRGAGPEPECAVFFALKCHAAIKTDTFDMVMVI